MIIFSPIVVFLLNWQYFIKWAFKPFLQYKHDFVFLNICRLLDPDFVHDLVSLKLLVLGWTLRLVAIAANHRAWTHLVHFIFQILTIFTKFYKILVWQSGKNTFLQDYILQEIANFKHERMSSGIGHFCRKEISG